MSIEEQDYFELVMQTAAKGLREFMEDKPVSVEIYEMDKPDVPLWCVWAIQQYAKEAGKVRCRELYMDLIRDIVDYLLASKHPKPHFRREWIALCRCEGEAITLDELHEQWSAGCSSLWIYR